MVKNRQKSQLLVGVPNNRPISAKKRKKYAKIFVKKSVDMGLISEKICMGGWVFPFPVTGDKMVKNRQKSQLLVGFYNNYPMIE